MAELIITRKFSFFGALLSIDISLNNEIIGTLCKRQSLKKIIPAGSYILTGRFRDRSNKNINTLSFSILENETKTIVVVTSIFSSVIFKTV